MAVWGLAALAGAALPLGQQGHLQQKAGALGSWVLAALARQNPREVEQSQRRETVMPPGIWEKIQRNMIFISGSQFLPPVRKRGLTL